MNVFAGPDFYHQLGHNDQNRCLSLLKDGKGAGAILSPRNIKREDKLHEFAVEYKSTATELIIDPQLYSSFHLNPQEDASQLENTSAWADPNVGTPILKDALQRQQGLEPSKYLVPAPFASSITESWLTTVRNFVNGALEWQYVNNITHDLYSTIAISVNVLEDETARLQLLNAISGFSVRGFYLISDMPSRATNPQALYGMLDLVFRLKRNGFNLLLGYTEPWAVLVFPFGLEGFASSGQKNRRVFHQGQWRGQQKSGGSAPKYFDFWSLDLLDSIRFPTDADALVRSGLWKKLYSASPHAVIFEERGPKEVFKNRQWTLRDSFDNYSVMMCQLSAKYRHLDYSARLDAVRSMVSNAQAMQSQLAKHGVELRGDRKQFNIWLETLDRYITSNRDQIMDEF